MTPRDARSIAEIRALLRTASGRKLRELAAELAEDDRAGVADSLAAALARDKARRAENARLTRLYRLQAELREQGYTLVAGVDEVGRGALAGPLTAGACVLPESPRVRGVDDSKRLTPARREELAHTIQELAICWSVAHVSAEEIDAMGMTAALRRAMGRAVAGLDLEPDHVVIDGRPVGAFEPETAVVKGDSKVASIAAASILAKVTRDRMMVEFAPQYPEYGFEINKGYGTVEHQRAIGEHGMSPLHRRSFTVGGGTVPLF